MSINSIDLVHYFLAEINRARSDPQSLIPHLQARKFVNPTQFVHSLMPNVHYKTSEGSEAVSEAIDYLSHKQPVPTVVLSQHLCEAAYQVGLEISRLHIVNNIEEYRAKAESELMKLGVTESGETEMIVEYGFREDPEIIPSIVVDDGDKNRTNRLLLLDEKLRLVGMSVHEHQEYDYVLIMLLGRDLKYNKGCRCNIF